MIIYNAIQTPDGTILESKHRHDYQDHKDKNGNYYAVDGGHEYLRRVGNQDYKELSLNGTTPFEIARKYFKWGKRYDTDLNLLPEMEWVILSELTDSHLDALCLYEPAAKEARLLFIQEKQFRNLTLENLDKKAIIKFNGGLGALLCSKCHRIIKTGFQMNEEEKLFLKGEIKYLAPQYCKNCK